MLFPPRAQNISIPAVFAGNILQNDDTSISVIDSGYDGTIVMRTENKVGLIVTANQKVSINTDNTESMLTINNDNSMTSTIRLSYQDQFYFDGRITETGNTVFIPSCDDLTLDPNLTTAFRKNLDILDHDGMRTGFHLGGMLITASATELNYVDVPVGTAKAYKALVLNADKNILGINVISATTLTGTLTTSNQPNIRNLTDIDVSGTFKINGSPLDITPELLSIIRIYDVGNAYANKALILDGSKNIQGINRLSANTLTGVLTSGPQPNITSLSALSSLTVNGKTALNSNVTIQAGVGDQLTLKYDDTFYSSISTNSAGELVLRASRKIIRIDAEHDLVIAGHASGIKGLFLGDTPVMATATQLNYTMVTPGTAGSDRAVVLDASKNILGVNLLGANILVGVVQTGHQPMITSMDTLNIKQHTGTDGLYLAGALVTASAANINFTNTTPGKAASTKALVLDSNLSISGINVLSASTLSGVLDTANQPNIKFVKTLTISEHNGTTGLVLGGTLVTATAAQLNALDTRYGLASPNKVVLLDQNSSCTGLNHVGASYLTGVLRTSIQPNITEVQTLEIAAHDGSSSGLSLNGKLVLATASHLNRLCIDPGTAFPYKAMIFDSKMSIGGINVLNANNLGGVLTTESQPNIRHVRTLNIDNHDGSTEGLCLDGELVTSTASELNYLSTPRGDARAGKALILDSTRDIKNINSLSAIQLGGVLTTPSQPNIRSVSQLNIMDHNGSDKGLSLNGVIITATGEQINRLSALPGIASGDKVLVLDTSRNIQGINKLTAVKLYGLIQTSDQPDLTSVNILDIKNHGGGNGLSLAGTLITASAAQLNRLDTPIGSAIAGKALIVDSTKSITGVVSVTAEKLTGVLQTEYQPNITSLNSLDITMHDGVANGLKLNNVLVSATAQQLNYTTVEPGKATLGRALVTNSNNSISGINELKANKVSADQVSITGIIANFNTGAVVLKTYSFTDLVGRIIDTRLIDSLSVTSQFKPGGLSDSFSCEMIGYIRPIYSENHTFYITCNDRVRLWVNGELILHSWTKQEALLARFSNTVFINSEQWTPIYIQFQVDSGSLPFFLLEWASTNTVRGPIGSGRLAWDNNPPASSNKHSSQNSFLIYNSSTTAANTAKFSVDVGGDLSIDASGNDILLGSADSLSIPSHDGSSRGLILGGVLVQPTAYELNYLKVSPGVATASRALILDASKSINGIASMIATTVACNNLQTDTFTIDKLTLPGPLNNYNSGSLLIRQITGVDVGGRVVHVGTINDINISNYDPRELATNFSLDIIGYLLPQYTEHFKFYAIANDRVRIWVGNTLVLNAWNDLSTGLEYTSSQILLTAGQWVPIYIQFQNVTGLSSLQVRWSSLSLVKSFISNSYMAWDNSFNDPLRTLNTANRISLYNTSVGLTTPQTAAAAVDSNGNMVFSSTSGMVSTAPSTTFNIQTHNGIYGLQLAGSLVKSTAAEINYLSGSTPGTATISNGVITDENKAIKGFTSITSTDFYGAIRTVAQPYITSLGTLTSTLSTSSDIVVAATSNRLRFASDGNACYIQAGSSVATNSACDLVIGNYGTITSNSSRQFVVKASGFVGIQTTNPARALTVNGAGATYAMRIVNSNSAGTETMFCDLGVDTSSNLCIGSNLIIGSGVGTATGTAAITVGTTGVMNITPSSGSLQIGNATTSALPLEVGSSTFTISTECGYINSEGSMGRVIPSSTTYSIRTASSIIVNGTVCITSDRRLKHKIQELSHDRCRQFILSSNPVIFEYKTSPTKHCGLIAQEVAKSKFSSIVKAAPHEGLLADDESPADAALNVSYEEIIPILMTTMKQTMIENDQLKQQVAMLNKQMVDVMNLLSKIQENNI